MFEALIQEWMKQHLNYLLWYATVSLDFGIPLQQLLKNPLWFVIVHVEIKDREIFVRYGLLFKAWERYRLEPPKALESLARVEDDYSDAAMKNTPEGCVGENAPAFKDSDILVLYL